MDLRKRSMGSGHDRRHSSIADHDHLAALGHKEELKRNHSTLSMLGLAFVILNTWTALSASLTLALPSGGSTAILWGLITAGICNLCLAASLAEFLSAYPTAGGQYHWVAIISWPKWRALLSWICGWINVFGWMALTATAGLLGSQVIVGIVFLYHPTYSPQPWHQFLIYLAFTFIMAAANAFGNALLPLMNQFAGGWSIAGFVIICITVLACASPDYNSAKFVFTNFSNETGWPDGLAWLLGLLQGALSLTGFDATAHMVEEIPNAAIEAPKLMVYCIAMGMVTGFIFLMVLLFVAGNIDPIIASDQGPIGAIIYHATQSRVGTVCLLIFPLGCLLLAGVSILTTSSRMTWAFARDGGLPFSKLFAKVHKGLDVPLNSIGLTTLVVVVIGCIFLGSSSAFNAIVSASVVALGVTYGMPPAINMMRGRRMLPPNRPFKLPEWLGWTANTVGVLWTILTTVLFVFPPAIPVTGSSMNYCIVAFAVVLIISVVQWFIDGRKNYEGPTVDIDQQTLTAMESHDQTAAANGHNGYSQKEMESKA